MKKIHLSADPANTNEDIGFWWNSGCNSVAAVSIDPTGIRFDGQDFTVIVDNPGRKNESVRVLLNNVLTDSNIVLYSSVKAKAS
jgi:hypothetical protein